MWIGNGRKCKNLNTNFNKYKTHILYDTKNKMRNLWKRI